MAGFTRSALALIIAAAAGQMMSTGCHAPPPVYIVKPPQSVPVPTRPPDIQDEIRPVCPEQGWIWIAGYWHWDGQDYQWVDGTWAPPREGYTYYGPNYVFVNNVWMYQAAYWYPAHLPHPGRHGRWHGGKGGHGHGGHGGHGHAGKGHQGSGTHGGKDTSKGSPDTPSKVRVSAPPADKETPDKVRVKAPPAAKGKDPDRRHGKGGAKDNKAGGAWSKDKRSKDKHLPAYDDSRRKAQAAKDKKQDRHLPAYDEQKRQVLKPSRANVKVLKGNPDYRGKRKGRMVFSNIPDGKERKGHGYPTDRTGAIILEPDKDKDKRGSAWKSAARVKPGGHRPDPSVVEVHTGDPKMKVRLRRSSDTGETEVREEKQPRRHKAIVDTRQRTHYRPSPAGQGSGARRPVLSNRPRSVHRPGNVHRTRVNPNVRRNVRPQPRPRPRRVVHRPAPRPQPRRVVHRPAPRPQPRRVVHRPAPRPQPRRVVHRPTPPPPKKRQRRAPPPPPPPKEDQRKRRR